MAKKTPKLKTQLAVDQATAENAPEKAIVDSASAKNDSKPLKPAALADSPNASKKPKKAKKASDKPNIFKRMWKGVKGILSELKKVTWPKGKDVLKATAVVIAVVFAFFIILFGIDYVLAGLLNLIVDGEWSTIFIGK